MKTGKVIGNIWATRKEERLSGMKLLIVQPFNPADDTAVSYTHLDVYKRQGVKLYGADTGTLAIALSGKNSRSFSQIQLLAEGLVQGAKDIIRRGGPVIAIVEEDIGKALGNALKARIHNNCGVLCVDSIHAESGDYVDIDVYKRQDKKKGQSRHGTLPGKDLRKAGNQNYSGRAGEKGG